MPLQSRDRIAETAQPGSQTGTLLSSRVGEHFQLPILGRLSTTRHRKSLQALAAGHEHSDVLARTIVRQACLPVLGQHTVVVYGQDFVVHIETILPAWGLALHLG